jgi:hypothetical protein
VTGYQEAEKKYKIKLDEGTKITAALPDNDIEILGLPPPLAKEVWKPAQSRSAARGATRAREKFAFPPRAEEDAKVGLDAIKEKTVIEPTRRPPAQMVHYAGVRGVERKGLPALWQAELVVCGHVRDLGVYDSPEEAAAAYNRAVVWFRTAAAGSRDARESCELAQGLAALVLNPVDGVAYSKELHAPPYYESTAADAHEEGLDACNESQEQEHGGQGAEVDGAAAKKLPVDGDGDAGDEGGEEEETETEPAARNSASHGNAHAGDETRTVREAVAVPAGDEGAESGADSKHYEDSEEEGPQQDGDAGMEVAGVQGWCGERGAHRTQG